MVDAEPDKYRPRRAFVEPDPTPAEPVAESGDQDLPKPLYRDEVPGAAAGSSATASSGSSSSRSSGSGEAGERPTRPITFTPRRTRSADEDATTILPRTSSGGRSGEVHALDDIDDERKPLGQRTKLALLIGAVAAVVVVGLAIGYAVFGVGKTPATTTPPPSVAASTDPSAAASPSATLLADDSLLSTADAGGVAKKSWKVASTERGASPDSPTPACFGPDPVEGQPTPQQRVFRLLSSSGKNAPGLLHEATAYATPEEAAQAYAVAAKTLGSCPVTGSYLFSGQTITGVGDQATGVIVTSASGDTFNQHTVVLNRTGRVMNIVDATQQGDKIAPARVAAATAAVTGRQCAAAGGTCPTSISIKEAPPPVGGDEPGFLATGDLPPAGKTPMPWVATPPEPPKDDFLGSQCESLNWATLPTKATTSRVYILQDSGSFFGLNEVVVTLKDKAAAAKLVDKITADWNSCEKRKLTAKVSKPAKVSGTGAQQTSVAGYTAEVSQHSTEGTKKYRVGIVSAGAKVAYTFLNPQDGLDFTDGQWNTVAVRAGQRATQVN